MQFRLTNSQRYLVKELSGTALFSWGHAKKCHHCPQRLQRPHTTSKEPLLFSLWALLHAPVPASI